MNSVYTVSLLRAVRCDYTKLTKINQLKKEKEMYVFCIFVYEKWPIFYAFSIII